MAPSSDGKITLLRHTVATLAYRGGKAGRAGAHDHDIVTHHFAQSIHNFKLSSLPSNAYYKPRHKARAIAQ